MVLYEIGEYYERFDNLETIGGDVNTLRIFKYVSDNHVYHLRFKRVVEEDYQGFVCTEIYNFATHRGIDQLMTKHRTIPVIIPQKDLGDRIMDWYEKTSLGK